MRSKFYLDYTKKEDESVFIYGKKLEKYFLSYLNSCMDFSGIASSFSGVIDSNGKLKITKLHISNYGLRVIRFEDYLTVDLYKL